MLQVSTLTPLQNRDEMVMDIDLLSAARIENRRNAWYRACCLVHAPNTSH